MNQNSEFESLQIGDAQRELVYRQLGLFNGFLIGLALAVGAWALQAASLAQLPVPLQHLSLTLGGVTLVAVNGFVGWLTSRLGKMGLTLLFWLGASVCTSLVIGYQPYYGRTLAVWLTDFRFWGLPIYPIAANNTPLAIIVAGFFIFLVLLLLATLQDYRLEAACRELGENGRLLPAVWWILLTPLPFVAGASLVTTNIIGDPSVQAIRVTHRAIERGRHYKGDLFELGLKEGLNYGAIQGVRGLLSDDYSLIIGGIDSAAVTTYVVAHFDNGSWINCRIVNGQLSFCYDASPPYTVGLKSLATRVPIPDECRKCLIGGDTTKWEPWFEAHREGLGEDPKIRRLAQWGSYVIMKIESQTGSTSIECWFHGIQPVQLDKCAVATPRQSK